MDNNILISPNVEEVDSAKSKNKKVLLLVTACDNNRKVMEIFMNQIDSLFTLTAEIISRDSVNRIMTPEELAREIQSTLDSYDEVYSSNSIFIDSGLSSIYGYIKQRRNINVIETININNISLDALVSNSAKNIKGVYDKRIRDFYWNNFFISPFEDMTKESTVYSKSTLVGELDGTVNKSIIEEINKNENTFCYYTRGTNNPVTGKYRLEIFTEMEEKYLSDKNIKLSIFVLGEKVVGERFYTDIRLPNELKSSYTNEVIGYFFVFDVGNNEYITQGNAHIIHFQSENSKYSICYMVGSNLYDLNYPLHLMETLEYGSKQEVKIVKGIEIKESPFFFENLYLEVGERGFDDYDDAVKYLFFNKNGHNKIDVCYKKFVFELKIEESRFIKSIINHLENLKEVKK